MSGWPDYSFLGAHDYNSEYRLDLTLFGLATNGDFDEDGDVDGQDFLIWQRGGSPNPLTPEDLAIWQENYGLVIEETFVSNMAVPEPGMLSSFALSLIACGIRRNRRPKPQAAVNS